MVTLGSVWKLKGHAYFTVIQNKSCMGLHPPSLDVHCCISTSRVHFFIRQVHLLHFLLSSILPNEEHAITMKCYTIHNIIILFSDVDIDVVT